MTLASLIALVCVAVVVRATAQEDVTHSHSVRAHRPLAHPPWLRHNNYLILLLLRPLHSPLHKIDCPSQPIAIGYPICGNFVNIPLAIAI